VRPKYRRLRLAVVPLAPRYPHTPRPPSRPTNPQPRCRLPRTQKPWLDLAWLDLPPASRYLYKSPAQPPGPPHRAHTCASLLRSRVARGRGRRDEARAVEGPALFSAARPILALLVPTCTAIVSSPSARTLAPKVNERHSWHYEFNGTHRGRLLLSIVPIGATNRPNEPLVNARAVSRYFDAEKFTIKCLFEENEMEKRLFKCHLCCANLII
jgi:hypothetical protein